MAAPRRRGRPPLLVLALGALALGARHGAARGGEDAADVEDPWLRGGGRGLRGAAGVPGTPPAAGHAAEEAGAAAAWCVVLDAGSSGTRVAAYRAGGFAAGGPGAPAGWSPWVEKVDAGTVAFRLPAEPGEAGGAAKGMYAGRVERRPGLASLAGADGARLRAHLGPLLDWARAAVPAARHAATPVLLMATAGVRKLEPAAQHRLLEACRRVLAASGFLFEPGFARVLTGAEEGAYGWLALNHLQGRLAPGAGPTVGLLDLGGSSMQVAHAVEPGGAAGPGVTELNLLGASYPLRVESYAHVGLNDAFEASVRELAAGGPPADAGSGSPLPHPCLLRGYTAEFGLGSPGPGPAAVTLVGAPDWDACQALAAAVVARADGLPDISGRGRFLGVSGFYVVYKFFQLRLKDAFFGLEEKGKAFCEEPWAAAAARLEGTMSLSEYCFRAAYLAALLEHGLKLEATSVAVEEQEGWALGAALLTSAQLYAEQGAGLGQGGGGGSVSFGTRVLILGFLCLVLLLGHNYYRSSGLARSRDRGARFVDMEMGDPRGPASPPILGRGTVAANASLGGFSHRRIMSYENLNNRGALPL